jgi:CDP-diacylglycerol--glycerol-3-phosphate 3-phosphatidyltransferase
MIDGTIARRMNTVSEFGARFDTAANFVFAAVCLIKFLPVISMPAWLQLLRQFRKGILSGT